MGTERIALRLAPTAPPQRCAAQLVLHQHTAQVSTTQPCAMQPCLRVIVLTRKTSVVRSLSSSGHSYKLRLRTSSRGGTATPLLGPAFGLWF